MKLKKLLGTALIASAALTMAAPEGNACSRVVYLGDNNDIILVGRTLDWRTPIPTNIYVYPQGMKKQSMPSGPMLKWTSRYGSVLAVGYDGGVTEGMNEAGLVMNGLFCKGSVYKEAVGPDDNTPVMSLAVLVSYFLDNFTTVDEAEAWLKANEFNIFGKTFDGGTVSLLHWALTDRTGNTLLLEYDGGDLRLFKGRDLQVLTNDPQHEAMEAINNYWKGVNGVNMLPGTVRSADRYVRASFFIHHVPTNFEYPEAFAALNSIMGTVSVPYGYEIEGEPNVSSTQWTSFADLTGGKYYFRFANNQGAFYIDLGRLRLNPGAPVLKLDTSAPGRLEFFGDVNSHLKKSEPFTPMW
ncbi:MAG: linear amide C-N hydrolase [Muribaculaceae bacterium]|nr:linear amide C-N hydrolase [Muribaculaceae bacterium]